MEIIKRQTRALYGCLVAGKSPWVQAWSAQPIGCTPACSVCDTKSAAAAAVCDLWRYVSVVCLCLCWLQCFTGCLSVATCCSVCHTRNNSLYVICVVLHCGGNYYYYCYFRPLGQLLEPAYIKIWPCCPALICCFHAPLLDCFVCV